MKIDELTMRSNNQLIDLPSLYHAIDRCPLTISPDSYVVDAIILMSQERTINSSPTNSPNAFIHSTDYRQTNTCVLVVEQGKLLGIFTTKDVIRVTANRINLSQVKIAQVMVQPVITLTPSPSQDIFTVLSLLRQHQICHLPILDQQEQLVGVVTETTLLNTFDLETLPQNRYPAEVMGGQTHSHLKKWLDAQTVEVIQVNEELQQALEELQVVEEELRQQNEQLVMARETAELERQRYQDLFEFAPHGYLVTDTTGVIKKANHAAATLLSVQQNHLKGEELSQFIAEQDRPDFRSQLQTLEEIEDWEIHLQPRSGPSFPASLRVCDI